LAVDDYTHFTSPIRRYPDLIVHRLVKARVREARGGRRPPADGTGAGRLLPAAPASLPEASRHCSERERVAVDAERASVKLKQVEYASDHVGDVFAGVITGVSAFGVFVQLTDLLVDGMVHVRDIDDDFYEYDEDTWSLIGTRRGRVFQVGKLATVVIVRADTESREIDLYFADETGAEQGA
jgi:ribonuclease R